MNDIVREFLLETQENLAQLDADLLVLEKEPREKETLARVFRTLHTVKGTAGFLGLPKLQAVAHAGETLLSRLRAGELTFNPDIATALLAVVDAIRSMLGSVEASENEGAVEYGGLIQTLERLTRGVNTAPPPPTQSPPANLARTMVGEAPTRPEKSVVIAAEPTAPAETRVPAVADSSIRVDVGLLDKLMTLVGELVLARNQILQFSNHFCQIANGICRLVCTLCSENRDIVDA